MILATWRTAATEHRSNGHLTALLRGGIGALLGALTLSLVSAAPPAGAASVPTSEPIVAATIPVGTNPFMPVLNAAGTTISVPNDRSAWI